MFFVYFVVFGGFACLFPLAFYCLTLASWNGRRPMLVRGPADFAGVLLATSGFLIVGGPLILAGLHENGRRMAEYRSFTAAWSALAGTSWPWLMVWGGYFVVVVGGAAWLLIRCRSFSVIYNIDPVDLQSLVADTLNNLKLSWVRRGGAYIIGFPAGEDAGSPALETRGVMLIVTVVRAMRHATLHWSIAAGDIRRRVEVELRRTLTTFEPPDNPAAGWFLAAATALFVLLLGLLGTFVLMAWRRT